MRAAAVVLPCHSHPSTVEVAYGLHDHARINLPSRIIAAPLIIFSLGN
jgi:hypothetical protein